MTTMAVRSRLAREPQTWVYLVAVVAMSILLVRHVLADTIPAGHHHTHVHGPPASPSLASTWLWWIVMTVAMMFPVAATGARRIAQAGLWRRRHVAMAEFLTAYLMAWALVGLAAVWLVFRIWPAGAPQVAVAVALLVAAAWQVTPVRRRMLSRCRSEGFVNVRGWRADRDCSVEGWKYARRCVVTCGPVMAVMALGHSLLLMVCLAVLLITERAPGPNPAQRAGRPFEAVCLVALAGVVLVV
jgi:predicted metal-binding membrane protein